MNVVEVFHKLNMNLEDVWKPAQEQFQGTGSYGNGGAMRIAPVPLFSYKNYASMLQIAKDTTGLTHTHRSGVNGALLQVSKAAQRIVHLYSILTTIFLYSGHSHLSEFT